ncbi:MAG TPA: alpha-L-glutamate ligase-like protein [Burkholderiaceae bacterium]|nr:alpha-L-glutamate ligase-like protein [Burkholderiaceae bacterium]
MLAFWKTRRQLREKGVMGINRRNADYVLKHNPRKYYPLVDNKVLTKARGLAAGINVPEQYAVISTNREIRLLRELSEKHNDFVIKPAQGAAGEGILVIADRFDQYYRTVSGRLLSYDDLEYQVANILTGMYSLAGARDQALIEYRVKPDPVFKKISYEGVPDIRIIVLFGYPIMAMVRLPTQQSGGKANLHQGAIGVGIDLLNGLTLEGSWSNARITRHPDTYNDLAGIQVPQWPEFMRLAASCYELCQLGYIGVDLVLDVDKGPLMLEVNARPGLNIQIANNSGLALRAQAVETHIAQLKAKKHSETPEERVATAQKIVQTLKQP